MTSRPGDGSLPFFIPAAVAVAGAESFDETGQPQSSNNQMSAGAPFAINNHNELHQRPPQQDFQENDSISYSIQGSKPFWTTESQQMYHSNSFQKDRFAKSEERNQEQERLKGTQQLPCYTTCETVKERSVGSVEVDQNCEKQPREKDRDVSHPTCSTLVKSYIWFAFNVIVNYIIGIFFVAFWASSWVILDTHVFPNDCVKRSVVCMCFGYPIMILGTAFQNNFRDASFKCQWVWRVLFTRSYTYIMSIGTILQWYGAWGALLCFIDTGQVWIEVTTMAAASSVLLVLRCFSAAVFPPIHLQMDTSLETYFVAPMYFETQPDVLKYFFWDCMFTALSIQTTVICFWKGAYSLFDICLYPENLDLTAIWCLIIAYSLIALLYPTQFLCVRLSARLEEIHYLAKLAFEDVIIILYTMVGVTYWRGNWTLLNTYIPYQPTSMYVIHAASFLIAAFGFVANTNIGRGCTKDGVLPNGQGVLFRSFYLIRIRDSLRERKRENARDEKDEDPVGISYVHKRVRVDLSKFEARENMETTIEPPEITSSN